MCCFLASSLCFFPPNLSTGNGNVPPEEEAPNNSPSICVRKVSWSPGPPACLHIVCGCCVHAAVADWSSLPPRRRGPQSLKYLLPGLSQQTLVNPPSERSAGASVSLYGHSCPPRNRQDGPVNCSMWRAGQVGRPHRHLASLTPSLDVELPGELGDPRGAKGSPRSPPLAPVLRTHWVLQQESNDPNDPSSLPPRHLVLVSVQWNPFLEV